MNKKPVLNIIFSRYVFALSHGMIKTAFLKKGV